MVAHDFTPRCQLALPSPPNLRSPVITSATEAGEAEARSDTDPVQAVR